MRLLGIRQTKDRILTAPHWALRYRDVYRCPAIRNGPHHEFWVTV